MSKNTKRKKEKVTRIRLAIINNDTHKPLFVIRGTKFKFISSAILLVIFIIALVFILVAGTPLRQFIPGYPSTETQLEALQNIKKIDSLEQTIQTWTIQFANIQRIINREEPLPLDSILNLNRKQKAVEINKIYASKDSLLRDEVKKQELFNLNSDNSLQIKQVEGMLFFPPIKGIITQKYDIGENHPYIDIATNENAVVKSVLNGTVIFSAWNDETGYTIHIQHENNLISIYKHIVKPLKQQGDKVTAGTPIGLVGNVGKLSTGPHLHFELWHNGEPIDPTKYINF